MNSVATESFAELFEQSQTNLAKLKPGAIVKGIVVAVTNDVVVINAGLKSEGIVPIEQFRNDAGEIDVGVAAGWADLDLDDAGALVRCTFDTLVGFREGDAGDLRVLVNGHDATDELRTETAGAAASAIAAIPEVRAALKDRQRAFRQLPGLVADGRDMGTVIFPDAGHKVFLTASADERAERRYKQLKDKGVSVTLDGLLREILARDARDASRAVAPLRPADDAVRIDTTGLGIDDVVARVLDVVSRPAG